MAIRSAPGLRPYDASDRKTFHSAVCHLLQTEFPGIFGPAITRLLADKIDEVYERFGVWQRFATKWAIVFTNSSQ